MFFNEWEILLVDDEPDVLTISKLAMGEFEVYGLPLKIHTATSKAEALDFLNNSPPYLSVAVAFIDVVMESDTAGLKLCQYIREEMDNHLTQLFVRTGQPGVAPERSVIDRYDINGYFTKAETTEDKLYTLTKSGVRQFLNATFSEVVSVHLNIMFAGADSRAMIRERFQQANEVLQAERGIPQHITVGGQTFSTIHWDAQTGQALMDRLDQAAGTPLGPNGDKYVTDEENHLFIKAVIQPTQTEACVLLETKFDPPVEIINHIHRFLTGLGALWQQAK